MSDVPSEPVEDFLGDISSNGSEGMFDASYEEVDLDAPVSSLPPLDDGPFSGDTTQVGDGNCIVCGSPTFRPPGLTKTGRKKRIPKYCDMHRPDIRVPSSGPGPKGMEPSSLGDSQLQRIQDELADDLRLLAMLAGPLLPVTGMYVYNQADPFTIAIIKLAKNNQTALRILHRAAQVAPIYTVAETLAGTAYAIQVDTRGADPHNTISQRLKVERAYQEVYPEGTGEQQSTFQGPPRYNVYENVQ